jgi:cysteine-rich repeat protein
VRSPKLHQLSRLFTWQRVRTDTDVQPPRPSQHISLCLRTAGAWLVLCACVTCCNVAAYAGVMEGLEECDDGDAVSGDGCSAECKVRC